jgi:hypothetical protein
MCADCQALMPTAGTIVDVIGGAGAVALAYLLAHWIDGCDPPETEPDSARPAVPEQAN